MTPAAAQISAPTTDDPVRLTAEIVVFDAVRELYEARGSVVVRQAGRTIRADWIVFNNATGQGVASGRVVMEEGGDALQASFLEFNVNTSQGVVFQGYLDSDKTGFEMHGDEIVKTGDETYTFSGGTFTTCDCPDVDEREPWQIAAGEADVELGGYATVRNASFDVLGIPLLWLPWAMVPVKTERTTGVLMPDFGVSNRNGVELGLPLFWAATDALGVTVTPRWLSDRGFKGDLELEYVVGRHSRGSLFGSFLNDDKIDPNSAATPFGNKRWSFLGLQDFYLPGDIRAKADFAFISDNQYPFDFDELRTRSTHRFLNSTAFATKALGDSQRFGAIGTLRFADDLQNPDDQDRDEFILQRQSAQLEALAAPLGLASWIVPAMDFDYSYFYQRSQNYPPCCEGNTTPTITGGDGVFVDSGVDGLPDGSEARDGSLVPDLHMDNAATTPGGTEGNGFFDEGELLADTGHRIDLWPRVGFPARLADRFEFYPEVGWRETLYQSDTLDFERCGMFTLLADLRTRFERRYGSSYAHILEPRIGYGLVTAPDQDGNPLFVPDTRVPQQRIRHLDLQNVLGDSADRVERFNGLVYGFANKIHRLGPGGRRSLLADFSISTQVNFETGRRRADWDVERNRFAPIYFDGRLFPVKRVKAQFNLGVDPEKANISEALAELWWAHPYGHALTFQYRYLRDIPTFFEDFSQQNDRFANFVEGSKVNQVSGSARIAFTRQWSADYTLVYSVDVSELIAQRGAVRYFSRCRCWSLGIEVSESRNRGARFNVLYELVGLGKRIGSGSRFLGGFGLVDGF